MPDRCHARRSDGALCEEDIGHYGGHIWPDPRPNVMTDRTVETLTAENTRLRGGACARRGHVPEAGP